jgi:hypothetical protein
MHRAIAILKMKRQYIKKSLIIAASINQKNNPAGNKNLTYSMNRLAGVALPA